jgi:hypothetical protein
MTNVILTDVSRAYGAHVLDRLSFSKKLGAYCSSAAVRKDIELLLACACPQCGERADGINNLRAHIRKAHGKDFCLTCLKYRKVFVREQTLYDEQVCVHARCTQDVRAAPLRIW